MSKVVIAGGGAAGMFAAVTAAENGHEVHIYEKNEKLGKKLFITGKGRCNLTNACDMEELFEAVCTNRKFLYSAFYGFTNQDTIRFFEECGLKTKVERGNRVFPVSDHSSDVIGALQRKLRSLGVKVHLNTGIKEILVKNGRADGVKTEEGDIIRADAVVIATGGFSYQSTGSTGDGYRFARELGHKVTELSPALVPLNVKEDTVKNLQGLSLRNVRAGVYDGKKCLYEDFGEMMFTHFGVTGPLILTASSRIQKQLGKHELLLVIDLKPALSEEQLDKRLLRDFEESKNKQFRNSLSGLFPAKLIPVMVELSGISPEKKVNEVSKEERHRLLHLMKNFELTITGLRDYNEAIITKGGVHVKEVNPATMESKLVSGVYFAGEVLDLDAVTGGFNLQIAWSTAHAAGESIL
jgi:predicted Rossmann fold flavoprotein